MSTTVVAGAPLVHYLSLQDGNGDSILGASFTVQLSRDPNGATFPVSVVEQSGGVYRVYAATNTQSPAGTWYALVEATTTPQRQFPITWTVRPYATVAGTASSLHGSLDTDESRESPHHTIGEGAYQAAAGDHTHSDLYLHSHALTVAAVAEIDGGGAAITPGVKGTLTIPFPATITGWRMKSPKQAGSAVLTVGKASYAGYGAWTAISGTEKPTLAAAQKNEDRALSTWATTVATDDELQFTVDSAAVTTRVELTLFMQRTIQE